MTSPHPILADMSQSGGQPHEMMDTQLKELREHFNSSLFQFAWTFFGFNDLIPSLHGQICWLLGEWGKGPEESADGRDYRRLMIQIPRGSYKTSLCTLSNSLWQVCRNPDETILICNEIMDNSKKWLRAIREIAMTNRLFQTIYRDILPPGIHYEDRENGISLPRWWKWNDQEIVFDRPTAGIPEASLTAAGVGSATTGGHWTRIIKDDLVSEDAKNSPTVMQRTCEWFDSSLPLEKPPYKGKDLVVCTPWTYSDVYRFILEKYNYQLYRRSVLELDETTGQEISLLPHKWTVQELHHERERDPYYFSAQMMCMPRAGREQSFQADWLRSCTVEWTNEPYVTIDPNHFDPLISEALSDTGTAEPAPRSIPLHYCQLALLVDPASADKRAKSRTDHARTGMIVQAIDPWGRRFLLDCWAGKGNPDDTLNHIFRLAAKWSITRIGIEEVTFSVVYQYWLRQEAQRRDLHLSIHPLKPKGRHKDDRIEELIPGFKKGIYYLNHLPSLEALRREYLDYPYAQTRDLLDALAYDRDLLRRPSTPGEQAASREQELIREDYDVTGYGQPYF